MRKLIEVRVECPQCGPLMVTGDKFRCEIEPGRASQGICELACPSCSRTVLFPTTATNIEVMWEAGAQHLSGAVPFELLETHSGAPISWDDLLVFALALSRSPWPQVEPRS